MTPRFRVIERVYATPYGETMTSSKPGMTRIVAGESAVPKRKRAIEAALAIGLVLLIAVGAVVASTFPATRRRRGRTGAYARRRTEAGLLRKPDPRSRAGGHEAGIPRPEPGHHPLSTETFNAGPAAIEALNAGAIDAAYIGPNPAINSFVKSQGESVSVIAGAAAGGAQLVVKPEINSAADLRGKTLASPQLGGTQDVALRAWLASQGYKTNVDGSGDVAINPTENAQTLKLFQDGKLDGAWLPEPWASRLVLTAGAKVLVDEKDLWDGSRSGKPGEFPTTILIVNKKFAADHPDTVKALLRGHAEVRGLAQRRTRRGEGGRHQRRPAGISRCGSAGGRPGPVPAEHHVHRGPARRNLPQAAPGRRGGRHHQAGRHHRPVRPPRPERSHRRTDRPAASRAADLGQD